MPSDCRWLIFLNALFQGGRLFIGAVCVLYVLSFGIHPGKYTWIKTAQAVVFIGLDIPLGYCLNKIGEYKSLLLSIVFGILGVVGYLISGSLWSFMASEIFLAVSLSVWPVALSTYSMSILDEYKIDGLTEKFFHSGDAVSNLVVLACGSLGALLYSIEKHLPYACFFVIYVCATVFLLVRFRDRGLFRKQKRSFSFSWNKSHIVVIPFALTLFLAQFLMQPLFHYWQPLFMEQFSVDSKQLSIIFITYSLVMSTVSWGFSRMTQFSITRSHIFIVGVALAGALAYSSVARCGTLFSSLCCFALCFGLFNLVQISTGVLLQRALDPEDRIVVTKWISFFSRIGMIISMLFLHYLFSNKHQTVDIYRVYGGVAISIFVLYLLCLVVQKRLERSYASVLKN